MRADGRVVITGLGVVSPCGSGVDAFWSGLSRPASPGAVRPLAGEDATLRRGLADAGVGHTALRRTDLVGVLALASAVEALAQAGLDAAPVDPDRAGVVLGAGLGGLYAWERAVLDDRAGRRADPAAALRFMPASAAAAVAAHAGFRGPCRTVSTACAAGTDAVADAARLVASGRCDVVVAGGAEAAATGTNAAALRAMRALSPSGVTRPFDVDRDGLVLAEAAAVVVVESAESARARGAVVLADVLGGASNSDAWHPTAPRPDGRVAAACVRLALAEAGLGPGDVRQVSAHGTGTPLGDEAEARALRTVFGDASPPVVAVKGATGHAMAASGAVEVVAAVLTLRHGWLPGVQGLRRTGPDTGLDLSPSGRAWRPGPVVSTSFGFGGHNASLVLAPPA